MRLGRLLCLIGWHKWRRLPNELGCFGAGLEWFERWECERCPATADRVRGAARGQDCRQVHHNKE